MKRTTINLLKIIVKRYSIIPITLVIFFVFSLFGKSFLTTTNILNVLQQSSIYGTMAIGMTFLIVSGYFDLSAGVTMGICANLVIMLQLSGCSILLSIALTLVVALTIGSINGILVAKAKINAFIVTLAMMQMLRGLVYLLTNAKQLSGPNPQFAVIAQGHVFGISYLSIIFLILIVIATVIMNHTKHGRNTYALGGNAEAAFNAGIRIDRTKLINFVICSLMAGFGGIMTASRMNAATPYLGYPDGSIMAITCVVLGGTGLQGGSGGVIFTLGGTLAYFMLRNGLNMMNTSASFYNIITGLILISIVTIEKLQISKKTAPTQASD